ncbi:hypothetical protein LEMLEM_LOCUS4450 [Lemmus lemmus]
MSCSPCHYSSAPQKTEQDCRDGTHKTGSRWTWTKGLTRTQTQLAPEKFQLISLDPDPEPLRVAGGHHGLKQEAAPCEAAVEQVS